MSRIEKFIMILIILIIVIIITICFIINRKQEESYLPDEEGVSLEYNFDETVKRVSVRNDYFSVEACINKFYMYYIAIFDDSNKNNIDKDSLNEMQKSSKEALYGMLDKEYIKLNEITEDNMLTKLEKINNSIINITDMYISERTSNMSIYIVEGTLRENISGAISNFKNIVKLDALNRTFTILPSDYVSKNYEHIKEGNKIKIEVPESIEKNNYNSYDYKIITDEAYVLNLVSDFKEKILYNSQLIYENLNDTYQSKKFKDVEEFKAYTKNNFKKYITMSVYKYDKEIEGDYIRYIVLDKNQNYYIFEEIAPMKYKMILDTYTMDEPEFVEKYEQSTDQEKVILNINKIMLALNDKDYKYIYSKLADSFKANTFTSYDLFERYMKALFFDENEFEYKEFGNEGGTYYTYKVEIKDRTNTNNNVIEKTFIMLLEEGTDFKISFNLK